MAWARGVQGNHADLVFKLEIHAECPYAGVVAAVDALRRAEVARIHFGLGVGS